MHLHHQVLNMRPQEILGMVEEAAGTRMFEDRKDKAKKTMGKKEKRVQELKDILNQEIVPKLNKLRAEKSSYMQYQKAQSELERIGRKLRAYEWTEYQKRVEDRQAEIVAKEEDILRLKQEVKKAQKQIVANEKKVKAVTEQKDAESDGKLKKLKSVVEEIGKALARETTQAELSLQTIKSEETKVVSLEVQLKDVRVSYCSLYEPPHRI